MTGGLTTLVAQDEKAFALQSAQLGGVHRDIGVYNIVIMVAEQGVVPSQVDGVNVPVPGGDPDGVVRGFPIGVGWLSRLG